MFKARRIVIHKLDVNLINAITITISVALAGSITCPEPSQIKNFARSLSPTNFVIEGSGIFGMWAFSVEPDMLIIENRQWVVGSWISQSAAETMEKAQSVALQNVITLDDGAVGEPDEDRNQPSACVYIGRYGAILLVTPHD